ncbi:thiamine-phosphate synthase [Endomicrobiia bacterium]|nr:thiamine-phosphate synthase [Endomicrobiia bacterium]GHT68988.1 thiamine-phosphate synthase [Endomicrobiia bacterium]GHT74315.1 thiamine-phosphate synthase [Endomicrobiia bacterium]
MKKQMPRGLYAITAENFSNGRDNITVAKQMLDAGIKILQYRDKHKAKIERFKQCEVIRKLTLDYSCFFIVNDDVDIALAVCSDGIHIGQDDLPLIKVRELAGDDITIGVSTNLPKQALLAVEQGADYVGVGPIYKTFTKDDAADPVGLDYLDFCVKNIAIPKVAIGGIKLSNLLEVYKYKPDNICMITEITSSQDIYITVKKIQEVVNAYC